MSYLHIEEFHERLLMLHVLFHTSPHKLGSYDLEGILTRKLEGLEPDISQLNHKDPSLQFCAIKIKVKKCRMTRVHYDNQNSSSLTTYHQLLQFCR